ncbi:MAG: alpha/beta hydrolase [Lachnospiraceae bacterium]|nr:alpha/beta hydrolase [Lachnospiraceae bacterium]
MIYKEIPIKVEGSQPGAKLIAYIQKYSEGMFVQERPMVILCPGGGYNHLSDREAESVALRFLAMGCHAAVLEYSVLPAKFPTQVSELAMAVKIVREHAKEWHVMENKIVVQGCSAGGHLAASLGMFWTKNWLWETVGAQNAGEIRPNGMILCYPVISSGKFAHQGSFDVLAGDDEQLRQILSLENQVNENTPKAFIWHTFTDETVPVENSLFLVSALRKYSIPTEFHLYPKGQHGLALATKQTASGDGKYVQEECSTWIELAKVWLEEL